MRPWLIFMVRDLVAYGIHYEVVHLQTENVKEITRYSFGRVQV